MQEALRDVNPEGAAFNRNDDYHEQEQVQTEMEPRTEEAGTATEEGSSKVLNRMWDDDRFFTRQQETEKGQSKRWRSIDTGSELLNADQKAKRSNTHRLDPINFCTISTYH